MTVRVVAGLALLWLAGVAAAQDGQWYGWHHTALVLAAVLASVAFGGWLWVHRRR